MEEFLEKFYIYLEYFAKTSAYVIEVIGIIAILFGMFRTIFYLAKEAKMENKTNVKIMLGNALGLGLEFKMGAEIIKTVIVTEATELIILGAVILLRAILALLVHWEIRSERKLEREEKMSLNETKTVKKSEE